MKNRSIATAILVSVSTGLSSLFALQSATTSGGVSSDPADRDMPVPLVQPITDESLGFAASSPNFVRFRIAATPPAEYALALHDLSETLTHDLGLAVESLDITGPSEQTSMPLFVSEASQGEVDLNGDGDAADNVLHLLDTTNYEILSTGIATDYAQPFGPFLVLSVLETEDGRDWNGDGVLSGASYLLIDPSDASVAGSLAGAGGILAAKNVLALSVSESTFAGIPIDLTGDGDTVDSVPFLVDASSGQTVLLPVPVQFENMQLLDDSLVMAVNESDWSLDLDNDGELTSTVALRYDFQTGVLANTGVQVNSFGLPYVRDFESTLLLPWLESGKVDLNGDGDMLDAVHTVYTKSTGQVVNLGLAGTSSFFPDFAYEVSPGILAVDVVEAFQSTDLNGDGDQDDTLWVLFDTVTLTQTVIPFAIQPSFSPLMVENTLLFALSEADENSAVGGDLNGDGLLEGGILHSYNIASGSLRNRGLRVDHPSNDEPYYVGDRLLMVLDESYDGIDRTGNGSVGDFALALVSPVDFQVTDFRLSVTQLLLPETHLGIPAQGSGPPLIERMESALGQDLNGDGDQTDTALAVLRIK